MPQNPTTHHQISQKHPNQKTLRKTLRKQRLSLTPQQRKRASYQAFRQLEKLPFYPKKTNGKKAKIGIYLDAFGELPVQPIIDWAKRHHFDIYLPVVIKPNTALKFIKMPSYHAKNWRLIKHSLGMRQPANLRQAVSVNQLDILFMPLVAVDKFGYRMGMGGGFYDRTLAKSKTKPIKIGWAYDFQFVEKLEVNAWDVKLDFAIFPSGLQKFKRHLSDFAQTTEHDKISDNVVSQVIDPARLAELLHQANAFNQVYSEDFF